MDRFAMFRELLGAAIAVCGGTQAGLARALGLKHTSTVNTWIRRERWPNWETICKMVDLVVERGGRLPDGWSGGQEWFVEEAGRGYGKENRGGSGAGLLVAGTVSAGKFKMAVEGTGRMEFSKIWGRSSYAGLVDAKQEVSLIKVDGDSMEPDFPVGAWLVCGRFVGRMADLPDRAPVVATAEGSTTFKLWHVDEGRVELLPLNIARHNVQKVAMEEVVVDWVVLGLVQPWTKGFGR